jgi:hypothetical protein
MESTLGRLGSNAFQFSPGRKAKTMMELLVSSKEAGSIMETAVAQKDPWEGTPEAHQDHDAVPALLPR